VLFPESKLRKYLQTCGRLATNGRLFLFSRYNFYINGKLLLLSFQDPDSLICAKTALSPGKHFYRGQCPADFVPRPAK
jgi:hypothetical protein